MNFLLYMLGRGTLEAAGSRPSARRMALSAAAAHAAAGRFDGALAAYRRLAGTHRGSALDVMIRAHLHLAVNEPARAHHYFAVGIERVLDTSRPAAGSMTAPDSGSPEGALERLLSEADASLKHGRYVQAGDHLRKARAFIDAVLSARAGMLLAAEKMGHNEADEKDGSDFLPPLAKLSDVTLRFLARICLAREVAGSLEQLQLREDLAPWATSAAHVTGLMESEYLRLAKLAGELPGHAETQYRLGLVARATGHAATAAAAFRAVLRLHPHHVSSATRLMATREETGGGACREALARAFDVPAETLARFATLCRAAGDPKAFEAVAARMCRSLEQEKQQATVRGNLAFALCEVAELGPMWAAWREPSTALASVT